jgi:hypothetical protein
MQSKNTLIYFSSPSGEMRYAAQGVSGELYFDKMTIAYCDDQGKAKINFIEGQTVELAPEELAYVMLSDVSEEYLTVGKVFYSGEGEATMFTGEYHVVLAVKGPATTEECFLINMPFSSFDILEHPYDVGGTYSGMPPSGECLLRYPMPRRVSFLTDLEGSQGVVAVPAADDMVTFDVKKNYTKFAEMQFGTGEYTAWFSGEDGVTIVFNAGDVLSLHAPPTADSALSGVGFSIIGERRPK